MIGSTSIADWLTAGGTVGAVVVAVFIQAFIIWRSHKRRPNLSLSFDRFAYTWEGQTDGSQVRYLRLAVTNELGRHPADDVEVHVLKIDGGPRGSGIIDRWYANAAFRWPNIRPEEPPRVTIPAGATRYLDLGRWRNESQGIPRFLFELALDMQPFSGRHLLEPGVYEIELALVPRNADATRWKVDLSFESAADDNIQPRNPKYSVGKPETRWSSQ